MIVVQLCEYTKNHWIVHFKWGGFYGLWITSQFYGTWIKKPKKKKKRERNQNQNPNGQVMRILPGLFAKGPRNPIVRINQCIHFENGITVCGCGSRNPSLLSLYIRTEAY